MPVSDKKREFGKRLLSLLTSSRAVLIVSADNVGSKQIQDVRRGLRGDATMLMGKNTTIRRVLRDYLMKNPKSPLRALVEHIQGNIGFVFTNGDVGKVREKVESFAVPAPARVGSVAPADVFIEPGPTGCDPGQTSWFQALNIPTKINKGQVEMIARVHMIKEGEKVTDSAAALLQKLNIRPFTYALKGRLVYDNGEVFDAAVLDIGEQDLINKLLFGARAVAALGLTAGLPTKASITHSINNAYKAVLSIGLGTTYKFDAVKKFEEFFANPGAFAPVAAAAAPAAAAVEEEEESEEEESVGGAAGMFGGSSSS
jgi:large subunit ribosomal protein LP0